MIRSRFKLSAEGSPYSGTTRVLGVDVAPERTDDVAEALRELVGRFSDHPVILPIIDAGVADGRPFYVTSTSGGEALDAALEVYGPAALADLLPRLQQLADALDLAGASGLFHGALTPQDIHVSADDTHLVGLGVAQTLQRAGCPLPPTAPYAAPEVDREQEISPSADQYAFAVIAHQWLFGRPLGLDASGFSGASLTGVDIQAMRRAFARATAAEPHARHANCTEFVRAVSLSVKGSKVPQFQGSKVLEFGALDEFSLREDVPSPVVDMRVPFATAVSPPVRALGIGALAVALLVGVVLGAVGMWLVGSGRGETDAPAEAGARSATGPGDNAVDRVDAREAAGVSPGNTSREVTESLVIPPGDDSALISPPRVASPPADAAPAAQFDAALLVHSTPAGATVTVDGVARGATPVAVRGLDVGTHAVAISRPGYRGVERQVVLTPERPSRTLEIELQSLPRAVPPAAVVADGSLVVDSRPAGAAVFVDGRRIGVTPLTLRTIAPGAHTVRLEHAGYRPVTTTIEVKAGERARVAARLEGGQDEE